jgi:GTP-binding protein Era
VSEPSASVRCGYAAVIGAPNAGKSTLVNALVGAKVTIVSHKVQTTRALVRGIVIRGASQIVLVDTPGIFAPRRRLDRAMVRTAWSGARDADLVLMMVDARRGFDAENRALAEKLGDVRRPRALVLNKVDVVEKAALLKLAAEGAAIVPFEATFMIAALSSYGVEDLARWLAAEVPPGPWLFPEDQISDLPMRVLAAEVTREKMYARLHDELPYASTVETDSWQARDDGSVRIEQTIYVEREAQRKIVLGRGGATIKAISMAAREELAAMVEAPVHLFLFVKVRENWGDDPERYRDLGLDFPKD